MKISFTIIAYQCVSTLQNTIVELSKMVDKVGLEDFEFNIITCPKKNGQDDGTIILANDFESKYPNKINHYNFSYLKMGEAFHKGIEVAKFDKLIMIPADNETVLESLIPVINKAVLFPNLDIIITYTSNKESRSLIRRIVSWKFKTFCNLIFGLKLKYHNGLCLYNTDHLKTLLKLGLRCKGYAFNLEILKWLIKKFKKTYCEIPIQIKPTKGSSAFKLKNIIPLLIEIKNLWLRF